LSDQQQVLADMHEAGEAPLDQDLAIVAEVVGALNEQRRGLRFTTRDVAGFFRSIGAVELGQRRIPIEGRGTYKPRVWALRNHDYWINAGEAEVGEAYLQGIGVTTGDADYEDAFPRPDPASWPHRAREIARALRMGRTSSPSPQAPTPRSAQPIEYGEHGEVVRF
jgi:hypothetical protein